MRCKFFLVLLVVFFISFISAGFEEGNLSHNIKSDYLQGEFVEGWINISLSNMDLNSTFETSKGDKINLSDLLVLNNIFSECNTLNCDIDYINISSGVATKTIDLIKGESKLVGFKFEEDMLSLNSIDFNLSSNAIKSCDNQLKADIFNDGSLEIINNNVADEFCELSKTDGCFDNEEASIEEGIITETKLCQRVELPESIEFGLGLEVSSITGSGPTSVYMSLYSLDNSLVGGCEIDSIDGAGEFFCKITGNSNEIKEYYLCVEGEGDTSVNYYKDEENGCGYPYPFTGEENYSYNLIAYSLKFAPLSNFSISNDYAGNFEVVVENYLKSKYGSLECSKKNCVIPIKLFSGVAQTIIIDELFGIYGSLSGAGRNIPTNFYDLEEIPLKYNSGYQQIYLDNANFNVDDGETFWLKLNGEKIFSQDMTIEIVPLIRFLSPLTTAATVPTKFEVNVDILNVKNNITNYNWDFGDNNSRDTKLNEIIYSYNKTGNFDVVVTITYGDGLNTSKTFKVLVETPIQALNMILKEKLSYLDKIKSQLDSLSMFHQTSIQSVLNLVEIENQLTRIKISFDSAGAGVADSYYIKLINDLLSIVLPNSVIVSKSAEILPFYVNEDKINVNALTLLDESSVDREKEYNDAILAWNLNNLVNTITYKEISADYGGGLDVLLNVFELSVNKKSDSDESIFLIIRNIDFLKFDKDYNKREIGDYVFIPLEDATSKVVFSTTQDVDFSKLPLFISPSITSLQLAEIPTEEEGISKWVLFSLIIFLLVLVAIVAYIILQKWYSKKYEDYLFKNKNDLYNLISFVENSKKKGVDVNKIIASLRKSGWNSEQMRYIIRKYFGKRTGMFEIPVEKLLNFFKKKQIVMPQTNISKKFPSRRMGINSKKFNPRKFKK